MPGRLPNRWAWITFPVIDSFLVKATQGSWKARVAGIEIRAASDGLYKIVSGRMTKVVAGDFRSPVITPNGRWVIANRTGGEEGNDLVRVNLVNGRVWPIEVEQYLDFAAVAYVPATGGVLVDMVRYYGDHYDEGIPDDEIEVDSQSSAMRIIGPETGEVRSIVGELRPLAQQSFRPLQKTTKPNEYWAALPDYEKNLTQVGIYSSATLSFRPVMTVPKIKFNSMTMWVDEMEGKVYFVYRGHLLAVPLIK